MSPSHRSESLCHTRDIVGVDPPLGRAVDGMANSLTREHRTLASRDSRDSRASADPGDSANWMPILGFWPRSCALAIAAVSFVGPASARDPLDPKDDSASNAAARPAGSEPIPITGDGAHE